MNKQFLQLFVVSILAILFFTATSFALAQDFKPQVSIPGSEFQAGSARSVTGNSIGNYISAIYKYGTGVVGILAAVVLMVAGVLWLTAGGNTSQVQSAKDWIKAALTGLILALLSYTILLTINPDLVNFRSITVDKLSKIEKSASNGLNSYDKYMSGVFSELNSMPGYKLSIAVIGNGDDFLELVRTDPRYQEFTLPDGTVLDNVYLDTTNNDVYAFYNSINAYDEESISVSKWYK